MVYTFFSLFESIQTLFWTGFGEVDTSNFDLVGIKPYTRFWGLLMFASYSVLNVTVLLNLLIAMMSNSFSVIWVNTILKIIPQSVGAENRFFNDQF